MLPGQGEYFDPFMIEMGKTIEVPGYATDIITEKSLNWMKTRNPEKPFFLIASERLSELRKNVRSGRIFCLETEIVCLQFL